jgi:hypothetical protein
MDCLCCKGGPPPDQLAVRRQNDSHGGFIPAGWTSLVVVVRTAIDSFKPFFFSEFNRQRCLCARGSSVYRHIIIFQGDHFRISTIYPFVLDLL